MLVWKIEGMKWRNTAGFLGSDKLGPVSMVVDFFQPGSVGWAQGLKKEEKGEC